MGRFKELSNLCSGLQNFSWLLQRPQTVIDKNTNEEQL